MDGESAGNENDELARVKWDESKGNWLGWDWWNESGSWFRRERVMHIEMSNYWFLKRKQQAVERCWRQMRNECCERLNRDQIKVCRLSDCENQWRRHEFSSGGYSPRGPQCGSGAKLRYRVWGSKFPRSWSSLQTLFLHIFTAKTIPTHAWCRQWWELVCRKQKFVFNTFVIIFNQYGHLMIRRRHESI